MRDVFFAGGEDAKPLHQVGGHKEQDEYGVQADKCLTTHALPHGSVGLPALGTTGRCSLCR